MKQRWRVSMHSRFLKQELPRAPVSAAVALQHQSADEEQDEE